MNQEIIEGIYKSRITTDQALQAMLSDGIITMEEILKAWSLKEDEQIEFIKKRI